MNDHQGRDTTPGSRRPRVVPLLVGVVALAIIAMLVVFARDASFFTTGEEAESVSYTIVAWAPHAGASDDQIAADLQARLDARGVNAALIRFTPAMALYPYDGPTSSIRSDMEAVVAAHAGLELWYTVIRKGSTFDGWPGPDTTHLEAARAFMNSSGQTYPLFLDRPGGGSD